MPDLWKALGDVYGDADTRSVPVEAPATVRADGFRTSLPLDDDLAAALSAALVDSAATEPAAPAAAPPAVAPVAPAVPAAPAAATPPPAPVAPAPVPVAAPDQAGDFGLLAPLPAPAPAVTPPTAATPSAPADEADDRLDGKAAERITAWLADLEERQRIREQGPPVAAIEAVGQAWQRSDDDIIPAASGRRRDKRDKKGRRKAKRAATPA